MKQFKKIIQFCAIFCLFYILTGCANRMSSTVSQEYKDKVTEVQSIGLTGQGASVAFAAFVEHGYNVKEMGAGENYLDIAQKKKIPYVAVVDKVGTAGSWWDGFFDYSMRIIDTAKETIVWSAIAEYGQGGVTINQVNSSNKAMSDMVKDFSQSFPPAE